MRCVRKGGRDLSAVEGGEAEDKDVAAGEVPVHHVWRVKAGVRKKENARPGSERKLSRTSVGVPCTTADVRGQLAPSTQHMDDVRGSCVRLKGLVVHALAVDPDANSGTERGSSDEDAQGHLAMNQ